MKISVNKEAFIKNWSIAERNAGTSGSMNIFSTVYVRAGAESVELKATDIRTSVVCKAGGVTVIEPGDAVVPIKGVSDLFKKAGSPEFTISVDGGQAVMVSGKSRYKFSTYPVGDFPTLPSSESGKFFCSINVSKLISAIERGTLCASTGDEYPQYLSSACFEVENGILNVVSTDKRRLALCRSEIVEGSENEQMLLPMKGLKELVRILGMIDSSKEITISGDDAQAFFVTEGLEFAVRKVESKFPSYAQKIPTSHTTSAEMDKISLLTALERVDVVVRDYNRTAILNLSDSGECVLTGRAKEFGEAVENIQCDVEGEPLCICFNTRFFFDAVKALEEDTARMLFNGQNGHMLVRSKGSENFLCLVAPIEISKEEMEERPADSGADAL
jgi:DNA polymerase-3 subunit beta